MTTTVQTKKMTDCERVANYCAGVLEGTIPACSYVMLAVERYMRDLETGHERGLYFDTEAAQLTVDLCRLFQHFEGKWAGEAFEPEDWQLFLFWQLFGWMRADGTRRFRVGYIEVPRGNGKTFLASLLGNYLTFGDGEPGAQVYAAATKMDQAKLIHEPAIWMVKASPAFMARAEIRVNNISVPETHSSFRPVGKDAKKLDGFKPHGAILDELHEHPDGSTWDVMRSGMGKRRQPLLLGITTAGFNPHGFCAQTRDRVIKILERVFDDDAWFGIIWTIDDGDDWKEKSSWIKANPNYGVSVDPVDFEAMAHEAIESPHLVNNFLTKKLDIWTTQEVRWANMVK